jgi:4-carboxymuconolactone decarboxylase
MTSLAYPDLEVLPQNLKDILAAHAPVNIYKMVMHSPGLAPGFFVMADAMFMANSLPPQLRELAILRVGHRYRVDYEVYQHERIAAAVGLSADAIAGAATGVSDTLPEGQAAIIAWTDSLLDNHTLSASERQDALTLLTVTQLADLVLTVGFYQLVCDFLNTFEVTSEGEPT